MFPNSVGHIMLMHVCMYLFLFVCRLWRTRRSVVCFWSGVDILEEKQRYQPQFSDEAMLSHLVVMWTREYAGPGVAGTDISSSKSSEMLGWYFFEIYSAGIVVIVLVACFISRERTVVALPHVWEIVIPLFVIVGVLEKPEKQDVTRVWQ